MDDQNKPIDKQELSSLYPEAKSGPLGSGQQTANYSRDRKYGSKPEYDLQKRVTWVGLLATILLVGAIIALAIITTKDG